LVINLEKEKKKGRFHLQGERLVYVGLILIIDYPT